MNHKKLKFFSILALLGLLLTACSVISTANWPGVSLDPSGKYVYVAYGTYVFKVDVTNGSMVWRYPDTAGSKQFYAPPGSSDSLVVVGDINDGLTELDASTKAEKWTNTQAQGKWIAGPIFINNTIIAPSTDGNVFAISSENGSQIWKYSATGPFWATPVSDGNVVYAPSMDHFLYALNVSDGSLVWKKDLGAACIYGLTLTKDGTIYISTLANEILSINSSNGDINWRFKAKGNLWAVPVVDNGTVYVGDLDNKVYAINDSDGTAKWEVDGGAPVTSAAAITPDGLIFATENGTLFAMNFNGTKSWSQTINSGKLYSAPVVTAGNLVVVGILPNAATDPLLVAYDFTGKQAWTFVMPK
jgi:outer membrane protein assembly factor BamB